MATGGGCDGFALEGQHDPPPNEPTPLASRLLQIAAINAMTVEASRLFLAIHPTRETLSHRAKIYKYLSQVLGKVNACAVPFAFGSVPLRMYLPEADIDIGVCVLPSSEMTFFATLRRALIMGNYPVPVDRRRGARHRPVPHGLNDDLTVPYLYSNPQNTTNKAMSINNSNSSNNNVSNTANTNNIEGLMKVPLRTSPSIPSPQQPSSTPPILTPAYHKGVTRVVSRLQSSLPTVGNEAKTNTASKDTTTTDQPPENKDGSLTRNDQGKGNTNGVTDAKANKTLQSAKETLDDTLIVSKISFVQARVNLLKLEIDGLPVDISVNTTIAAAATCFFEEVDRLIGLNHLFKRTALLVKAWGEHEMGIIASHNFLLSSLAVETMLLYVMNVHLADEIRLAKAQETQQAMGSNTLGSSSAERLSVSLASPSSSVTSSSLSSHSSQSSSHIRSTRPVMSPFYAFMTFISVFASFDFDRYCITVAGPVSIQEWQTARSLLSHSSTHRYAQYLAAKEAHHLGAYARLPQHDRAAIEKVGGVEVLSGDFPLSSRFTPPHTTTATITTSTDPVTPSSLSIPPPTTPILNLSIIPPSTNQTGDIIPPPNRSHLSHYKILARPVVSINQPLVYTFDQVSTSSASSSSSNSSSAEVTSSTLNSSATTPSSIPDFGVTTPTRPQPTISAVPISISDLPPPLSSSPSPPVATTTDRIHVTATPLVGHCAPIRDGVTRHSEYGWIEMMYPAPNPSAALISSSNPSPSSSVSSLPLSGSIPPVTTSTSPVPSTPSIPPSSSSSSSSSSTSPSLSPSPNLIPPPSTTPLLTAPQLQRLVLRYGVHSGSHMGVPSSALKDYPMVCAAVSDSEGLKEHADRGVKTAHENAVNMSLNTNKPRTPATPNQPNLPDASPRKSETISLPFAATAPSTLDASLAQADHTSLILDPLPLYDTPLTCGCVGECHHRHNYIALPTRCDAHFSIKPLNIVDPMDPSNNIGMSVSSLGAIKVKESLNSTHKALTKLISSIVSGTVNPITNKSPLPSSSSSTMPSFTSSSSTSPAFSSPEPSIPSPNPSLAETSDTLILLNTIFPSLSHRYADALTPTRSLSTLAVSELSTFMQTLQTTPSMNTNPTVDTKKDPSPPPNPSSPPPFLLSPLRPSMTSPSIDHASHAATHPRPSLSQYTPLIASTTNKDGDVSDPLSPSEIPVARGHIRSSSTPSAPHTLESSSALLPTPPLVSPPRSSLPPIRSPPRDSSLATDVPPLIYPVSPSQRIHRLINPQSLPLPLRQLPTSSSSSSSSSSSTSTSSPSPTQIHPTTHQPNHPTHVSPFAPYPATSKDAIALSTSVQPTSSPQQLNDPLPGLLSTSTSGSPKNIAPYAQSRLRQYSSSPSASPPLLDHTGSPSQGMRCLPSSPHFHSQPRSQPHAVASHPQSPLLTSSPPPSHSTPEAYPSHPTPPSNSQRFTFEVQHVKQSPSSSPASTSHPSHSVHATYIGHSGTQDGSPGCISADLAVDAMTAAIAEAQYLDIRMRTKRSRRTRSKNRVGSHGTASLERSTSGHDDATDTQSTASLSVGSPRLEPTQEGIDERKERGSSEPRGSIHSDRSSLEDISLPLTAIRTSERLLDCLDKDVLDGHLGSMQAVLHKVKECARLNKAESRPRKIKPLSVSSSLPTFPPTSPALSERSVSPARSVGYSTDGSDYAPIRAPSPMTAFSWADLARTPSRYPNRRNSAYENDAASLSDAESTYKPNPYGSLSRPSTPPNTRRSPLPLTPSQNHQPEKKSDLSSTSSPLPLGGTGNATAPTTSNNGNSNAGLPPIAPVPSRFIEIMRTANLKTMALAAALAAGAGNSGTPLHISSTEKLERLASGKSSKRNHPDRHKEQNKFGGGSGAGTGSGGKDENGVIKDGDADDTWQVVRRSSKRR